MDGNKWREVMEDECIISWCTFVEDDPKKTLNNIICQNNAFALDPLISREARDLVLRGRKEVLNDLNLTETLQPIEVSVDDKCHLEHSYDNRHENAGDQQNFDLATDILKAIKRHGFVVADFYKDPGALAGLVTNLLGELYSPNLQQWIVDHDSGSK